jgi:hypothetical protein
LTQPIRRENRVCAARFSPPTAPIPPIQTSRRAARTGCRAAARTLPGGGLAEADGEVHDFTVHLPPRAHPMRASAECRGSCEEVVGQLGHTYRRIRLIGAPFRLLPFFDPQPERHRGEPVQLRPTLLGRPVAHGGCDRHACPPTPCAAPTRTGSSRAGVGHGLRRYSPPFVRSSQGCMPSASARLRCSATPDGSGRQNMVTSAILPSASSRM